MKKSALVLSVTAILGLTACDHYSSKMAYLEGQYEPAPAYAQTSDVSQIEPAAGASMGAMTNATISPMRFSKHLKNNYIQQARYEQSVSDYKAAKTFTEKAYTLSNGQLVAPSSLHGLDVSAEQRGALSQARSNLMDALKTKAMPENREMLAKAQVSFDCWVDQATEAKEQSICQQNFDSAMNALVDPNVTTERYAIAFEAGKVSLSNEDREIIGGILRDYVGKENSIQGVELVGGNDPLSENRLSVLRSILQYNGVPADKITKSTMVNAAVGEQPIQIIVKERVELMNAAQEVVPAQEQSDSVTY